MNFFKKKLIVPTTNETTEIEAVQLWSVRWTTIKADSYLNSHTFFAHPSFNMEAFTSKKAADEFAQSLISAFKLTRDTSEPNIKVEKMP